MLLLRVPKARTARLLNQSFGGGPLPETLQSCTPYELVRTYALVNMSLHIRSPRPRACLLAKG